MNEFVSWEMLGSYGGCLAMVVALVQFTKGLRFIQKIPTQILSYIFALAVLIIAHSFTNGWSVNMVFQMIFNAVIISLASNGAYSVGKKIANIEVDNGKDNSES